MPRPIFPLILLSALLASCADEPPFPTFDELESLRGLMKLRTVPPDPTNRVADDPAAAQLGEALFSDTRLSSCNAVSCANCHPAPSFASSLRVNGGCDGKTRRNTPTLLNVGFRRWFYWDGQKDSLWSHAELPLTRRSEMASTPEALRDDLQELVMPGSMVPYREAYSGLFGADPASHEPDQVVANFGKALAAFLRTKVRMDAPFDDELRAMISAGEEDIAAGEERLVRELPNYLGLKTFLRKGCINCHKGPHLSDDAFHNLGVEEVEGTDRGREVGLELLLADPLRSDGPFSDDAAAGGHRLAQLQATLPPEGALGAFKTPSLRNVALSAPYLHTGRLNTLEEVVEFYDRGGDPEGTFLGKRAETMKPLKLTPEEKAALVRLLESLTGAPTSP